jgi:hypothetical protein
MAGTISSSCVLNVNHDNLRQQLNPGQKVISQAVARGPSPGCVIVAEAADTEIDFSELATLGVIQVTNLDDTNYVDFGPDDGAGALEPALRIKAGESWQFRLVPGVTYYARADTADCAVLFSAFND